MLPLIVRRLILIGWMLLGAISGPGSVATAAALSTPATCGIGGKVAIVQLPATVDASHCLLGYVRIAGLRIGDLLHLGLSGSGRELTIFTTSDGNPEFTQSGPVGTAVCDITQNAGAHADCQVPASGTFLVQTIGRYKVSLSVTHPPARARTLPGACAAATAPLIQLGTEQYGIANLCGLGRLYFKISLQSGDRVVFAAAQGPHAVAGLGGTSSGVMLAVYAPGTTDLNIDSRTPICTGASGFAPFTCHSHKTGVYVIAFIGLGDFTTRLLKPS